MINYIIISPKFTYWAWLIALAITVFLTTTPSHNLDDGTVIDGYIWITLLIIIIPFFYNFIFLIINFYKKYSFKELLGIPSSIKIGIEELKSGPAIKLMAQYFLMLLIWGVHIIPVVYFISYVS